MDTSNFIQTAACLNNEAVLLLTSGCSASLVTAFQMLKDALGILTTACFPTYSNSSSSVLDMCKKSQQSQSRLSPSYVQLNGNATTSIKSYEKTTLQTNSRKIVPALHTSLVSINIPKYYGSNQAEHYFIYDRLLAFHYPNALLPDNLPFYCSVVMFNVAVMVHLSNERKKTKHYLEALRCYKLVLSLLDEAEGSTESDFYGYIKFLRVATLNNIAMTHHDLCQFQEERTFLDKVILSFTSKNFIPCPVFDKICYEGCLVNAMLALVSLPHAPSA